MPLPLSVISKLWIKSPSNALTLVIQIINNPKRAEILREVDVLIDGKFQADKRDIMLKYRGSSNQRVIDVKKSLEQGNIVEIL